MSKLRVIARNRPDPKTGVVTRLIVDAIVRGAAALVATALVFATAVLAADKPPSAADRWERSLLEMKKAGTLPGPRPGQRCLWSARLGACLWYSPSKFNPQR